MGAACYARKKIKKSNIETIENESQNLQLKLMKIKKRQEKKKETQDMLKK